MDALDFTAAPTMLTADTVDLGSLGGNRSSATGVSGTLVIGSSTRADGTTLPFVYDLGATNPSMRDIPGAGYLGRASAVDGKVVVGTAASGTASIIAFAYDLGVTPPIFYGLGNLGWWYSSATAVDGSWVVGQSATTTYPLESHAFAYDLKSTSPSMRDLGTLGGPDSEAVAVDGTIVVGTADVDAERSHAFVYDLSAATPTMRDLGTLGGPDSEAVAVDGTIVVGTADVDAERSHAFVYDLSAATPTMRDLGTLGGPDSAATSVSGSIVVGTSLTATHELAVWAYDLSSPSPRMLDLGTVSPSAPPPRVDGHIVVGTYPTPAGDRAFAYELGSGDSQKTDLGTLGAPQSEASAVSGNTVVGTSFTDRTGTTPSHALAWTLHRSTVPTLELTQARYSTREDGPWATIALVRSGYSNTAVSVHYAADHPPGGARAGRDFEPTAGTISFAPGETRKTFRVRVLDDPLREGRERIRLTLSSPTDRAVLGLRRTADLVIRASDQQPDAWISSGSASPYVGQAVYNTTAAGQTRIKSAGRGETRIFYIRVASAKTPRLPSVPIVVRLKGSPAPPNARVVYSRRGKDVTATLRSPRGLRLLVDRWPGDSRLLAVKITLRPTAKFGSSQAVTLTETWKGDVTRRDRVKAVVRVTR